MMRKLLLSAVLLGAVVVFAHRSAVADSVVSVPAPAIDAPLTKTPGRETAVLSGGCFWGMQLVFQHVKGVDQAVAGYTGGAADTAFYEDVSTGTTGHAESVKIVFDPSVVSFGTILRVYFSVATNPTQLNYQSPDEGTQYRGEIWAESPAQQHIAISYIQQLTAAHVFSSPIVTRVDEAMPFYPAESYHQNFATVNPYNPYIATFDAPKAVALQQLLPGVYTSHAVLVPAGPG